MLFDSELLTKAMDSEARMLAARGELTRARNERDADLYGLWRAIKDPKAVAAHMPPSVTSRTMRSAVLKLAPREDFVQPSLFEAVAQSPTVELAA